MAELRIAITTPQYPLDEQPARAPFLHRITHELASLAHVGVFLSEPKAVLAPHHPNAVRQVRYQGIDIQRVPYPAIPGISRLWNGRSVAHALLPPLRTFRPDVILGYWIYPDGYGAWQCARSLDRPCVLGGLGTDIRLPGMVTRHLTGRALRGADQTIMVSEEMRRRSITDFGVDPSRVHTIPNGVDTTVFFPRDRQLMKVKQGVPSQARLIIYVGRLVHTKGLRELLDAFKRLAIHDDTVHLALVGGGPMTAEIARFATAQALTNRIHLPGPIAGPAVADWIGASDLVCLPSYSEGHPNVLVEALASGRPVVATHVGGIPEIVTSRNAILVPPRDTAKLHLALAEALAREWALTDLTPATPRTWRDVAQDTLQVCQSAIARSQSS